MANKVEVKNGKLNHYAFRCGYVEKHGVVQIFLEPNGYHVRDFNGTWEVFPTIKTARKFVKDYCKSGDIHG